MKSLFYELYFFSLWAVLDEIQKSHGKLLGVLKFCKFSAFILSFSAFNYLIIFLL